MATSATGVINTAYGSQSGLIGNINSKGGYGQWQTPGYIRSALLSYTDWYVGLGTEVSGSTIRMFPLLDTGLMVLYFVYTVVASTGSLTMSIGDLDSATRYASASSNAATAGCYIVGGSLTSTGPYIIGTNPATPTATDTDAQIVLTTGGATLGATNVFQLTMVYSAY
jgi:hypothetical protein